MLILSKFGHKKSEITQTKTIMLKWGELHEEDGIILILCCYVSGNIYVLWWSTLLSKTISATNEKMSPTNGLLARFHSWYDAILRKNSLLVGEFFFILVRFHVIIWWNPKKSLKPWDKIDKIESNNKMLKEESIDLQFHREGFLGWDKS